MLDSLRILLRYGFAHNYCNKTPRLKSTPCLASKLTSRKQKDDKHCHGLDKPTNVPGYNRWVVSQLRTPPVVRGSAKMRYFSYRRTHQLQLERPSYLDNVSAMDVDRNESDNLCPGLPSQPERSKSVGTERVGRSQHAAGLTSRTNNNPYGGVRSI